MGSEKIGLGVALEWVRHLVDSWQHAGDQGDKGGVKVQCQGRVLVEAVELAGTAGKDERVAGNIKWVLGYACRFANIRPPATTTSRGGNRTSGKGRTRNTE